MHTEASVGKGMREEEEERVRVQGVGGGEGKGGQGSEFRGGEDGARLSVRRN